MPFSEEIIKSWHAAFAHYWQNPMSRVEFLQKEREQMHSVSFREVLKKELGVENARNC